MPLTYTPEDGTGLANANGYASLAFIRAYNAQRGVTVSADDDELTASATLALDVIEGLEPRFVGMRAFPTVQALSWPRVNLFLFGQRVGPIVPQCVLNAHAYLTGIQPSYDFAPIIDGLGITKEVIGPLETDYDTKSGASLRPIIPQLTSLLQPVFTTTGSLRVSRA